MNINQQDLRRPMLTAVLLLIVASEALGVTEAQKCGLVASDVYLQRGERKQLVYWTNHNYPDSTIQNLEQGDKGDIDSFLEAVNGGALKLKPESEEHKNGPQFITQATTTTSSTTTTTSSTTPTTSTSTSTTTITTSAQIIVKIDVGESGDEEARTTTTFEPLQETTTMADMDKLQIDLKASPEKESEEDDLEDGSTVLPLSHDAFLSQHSDSENVLIVKPTHEIKMANHDGEDEMNEKDDHVGASTPKISMDGHNDDDDGDDDDEPQMDDHESQETESATVKLLKSQLGITTTTESVDDDQISVTTMISKNKVKNQEEDIEIQDDDDAGSSEQETTTPGRLAVFYNGTDSDEKEDSLETTLSPETVTHPQTKIDSQKDDKKQPEEKMDVKSQLKKTDEMEEKKPMEEATLKPAQSTDAASSAMKHDESEDIQNDDEDSSAVDVTTTEPQSRFGQEIITFKSVGSDHDSDEEHDDDEGVQSFKAVTSKDEEEQDEVTTMSSNKHVVIPQLYSEKQEKETGTDVPDEREATTMAASRNEEEEDGPMEDDPEQDNLQIKAKNQFSFTTIAYPLKEDDEEMEAEATPKNPLNVEAVLFEETTIAYPISRNKVAQVQKVLLKNQDDSQNEVEEGGITTEEPRQEDTTMMMKEDTKPSQETATDEVEKEETPYPVGNILNGIMKFVQNYIQPKPETDSKQKVDLEDSDDSEDDEEEDDNGEEQHPLGVPSPGNPLVFNVHNQPRDQLIVEAVDEELGQSDPFFQMAAPNLRENAPPELKDKDVSSDVFPRPQVVEGPHTISPFNSPALIVQNAPRIGVPESPVASALPISAPIERSPSAVKPEEPENAPPLPFLPGNFLRAAPAKKERPTSFIGPVQPSGSLVKPLLQLGEVQHHSREPVKIPIPDLIFETEDFSEEDTLQQQPEAQQSPRQRPLPNARPLPAVTAETLRRMTRAIDSLPETRSPSNEANFTLTGPNTTENSMHCSWNIKTEAGLYLLVTFHNLSAPYTVNCEGAFIEVERENNGFEARWCGNRVTTGGSRPHVIFAKNEVRITVFDDGSKDKEFPTGFTADVEVIDLFDGQQYTNLRKTNAYSNVRKLVG